MELPPVIDETRVHRALGDPSRVRVLEVLRAAPRALDATELAERVGLHANTVRSHLRILAQAQLVSGRPEERTRPGRPRLVYAATAEGVAHEERAGYRLLAEILASYLAGAGAESSEQAEAAGRAWGRYLVDGKAQRTAVPAVADRRARTGSARTVARSEADEDVATVVGLLDEFGFAPEVVTDDRGHTVLMQHCPFGEVADDYRKVVCSVHLGLMQGALAELGAHVEADGLEPFVRPGVCAAHLGGKLP
jgi:predicted ArsR family transcriptional regulator